LQFNLHHLTEALIKAHLEYILNQEQTAYEEGALAILAYAAQGSMRDALSLLDQTITGCEDKLLVRDVKALLGYTQQDYAQQVLQALARQEGPQLIELSRQIVVEGGHFNYVLDQILHYVHQIALYQQLGKESPLLVSTPEIVDLAAHFSAEDIQLFYQISLKGREEINLAPSLFIGFNMVLLRMLMFRPVSDCSSLSLDPPAASPPTAVETNSQKNADNQEAPEGSPKLRAVPPDVAAPSQNSKPIDASNWSHIVTQLKLTGLALNAISNAEFVAKDQKTITLKVAKGHYSLFTPTTFSKIEHGLSHYLNTPVKINLLTEQQIQASPAQEKERSLSEQKQKASSELENDVVLQRIKKEFSAELVKNSIVLLKDGL
jgi:DNA polymerase-3 subunit gamma/tau